MEVVNLSGAGLVDEEAPALAEHLSKFPALKHLDVSANPGLRLLPIGRLRIAATLETFKCDGFSLLLPPQSMFSTPEENPWRIQQLLTKGSSAVTVLTLSAAELTSITAREVAALLPLYPALKHLDVSDNPGLDFGSLSLIFEALSGKTFFFLFKRVLVLLRFFIVSPGAVEFAELNLGGIGVDSLPEDIPLHTPNLKKLTLDHCVKLSCLPVQLGSLKRLEHVSVKGCTALVHPPASQRADPSKTATFLQQLHVDSEIWRRLKVPQPPCLARCCRVTRRAGCVPGQRAQRENVHAANAGQEAAAA